MTLIICALKLEAKPYLSALRNIRVKKTNATKTYHGEIEGTSVIVAKCGVGVLEAAKAAQALLDKHSISRVIMSGTAGWIDRNLKIGDTVISEEILFHDDAGSILESAGLTTRNSVYNADSTLLEKAKKVMTDDPPAHPVYFGMISTGRKFVAQKDFDTIAEKFNPLCADMESAAVAHVSGMNDIPFISVRSISDNGDKSGIASFLQYASQASLNSFIVVSRIIKARQM